MHFLIVWCLIASHTTGQKVTETSQVLDYDNVADPNSKQSNVALIPTVNITMIPITAASNTPATTQSTTPSTTLLTTAKVAKEKPVIKTRLMSVTKKGKRVSAVTTSSKVRNSESSVDVLSYRGDFESFQLYVQTRPPLSEREKYSSSVKERIEAEMAPKLDGNGRGKAAQFQGAGKMSDKNNIVSDAPASPGQFPWHTAIIGDSIFFCSGALISTHWVITVASCVDQMTKFVVHLGMQDRYAFEMGRISILVENKYVHKDYSATNLKSNLALLYLPYGGITLNSGNIQQSFMLPIRLPSKSDAESTFEELTTGAYLTGWGRDSSDSLVVSDTLTTQEMTVINNMECAEIYGSSIIVSSTLCVQPTHVKYTCNVDIGSPIVFKESDSTWSLLGLVSFTSSIPCSQDPLPIGLTRVTSYLGWISSTSNIQLRA